MKRFSLVVSAVLFGLLLSCRGFKEAMTAHVDVVAHAGNQELSVTRLATWLSKGRSAPPKEFARIVARLWVDDQLLGLAAAHGDSLNQPATEDSVLWGVMMTARISKWFNMLADSSAGDSSKYPAAYAAGEALAARHILLVARPGDTSAKTFDSLHRAATELRSKLTAANFAEMAKQYSKDPGSARSGGDLGIFRKGEMVAPFDQALLALRPGEISQPVKTQYGYHLIYRLPYSEAKTAFVAYMRRPLIAHADTVYASRLDSMTNAKVTSSAATTAREVAKDLQAHRNDKTVLATTSIGNFTAADYARWLSIFPPQIMQQIQSLPDSMVPKVVQYVARNQVMVHQMDSAHVKLDSAELSQIRTNYMGYILDAWRNLNVDPKGLTDSAKSETDRERIAAARVDTFFDKLFSPTPTVRPIEVPEQLDEALRDRYTADVSETGLDRAVAKAAELHKQADSARVAAEPPSAVPLPGSGPMSAPKKP